MVQIQAAPGHVAPAVRLTSLRHLRCGWRRFGTCGADGGASRKAVGVGGFPLIP